ncbi:MAG: hypothetical protein AAF823_15545 [Planctomycetota bacterium]
MPVFSNAPRHTRPLINLRTIGLMLAAVSTVVFLTPHLPASSKRDSPAGTYRARGAWIYQNLSGGGEIGPTNFKGSATLKGKRMKFNTTAEDDDGEDVATKGSIRFKRKPSAKKKNLSTPGRAEATLRFDATDIRDKFDLDLLDEPYQFKRNRKKKWVFTGAASGFLDKRRLPDGSTTDGGSERLTLNFRFVSN